jgi:hypothetical protein
VTFSIETPSVAGFSREGLELPDFASFYSTTRERTARRFNRGVGAAARKAGNA